MLGAVAILKHQHRVIENVLRCLEVGTRPATGGSIETGSLRECVDFFRRYADAIHHHLEEEHLFPALERHGIPRRGGPIGVMLDEHVRGRACIAALEAAISDVEEETPGAQTRLADAARDYVDLLTAHIRKEDEVLFEIAREVLTAEDAESLTNSFHAAEAHNAAVATELEERARSLCERWNLAYSEAEPPA
jgi:hemerythrin-like domain-containing protein